MWSDAIDGPYSWIDHSQSSENIVLSVLTFLRLYTQGCTLCYLISRFQRFLTIKIESCFYLLGKQDCAGRSEEHTSELQSRGHLVCRLLLAKKKSTLYTSSHSKYTK